MIWLGLKVVWILLQSAVWGLDRDSWNCHGLSGVSPYIFFAWLAWASSQHGDIKIARLFAWFLAYSRVRFSRHQCRNNTSSGFISEVTGKHFCNMMLVKAVTGSHRFKRWRNRLHLLIEELPVSRILDTIINTVNCFQYKITASRKSGICIRIHKEINRTE